MEIGLKNVPQTQTSTVNRSKTNASAESTQGFINVFVNIMTTSQIGHQAVPNSEQVPVDFSEADLKSLLSFLNTTDVLELEGGSGMLDEVMSNAGVDVSSMIQNLLGMDGEEWKQLLAKLTEALNIDLEDAEEMDRAQLEMLVSSLLSLPPKDLQLSLKDTENVMKAAKLFELLSVNQDSLNKDSKLNELVKQMMEKLEKLVPDNKSSVRFEYLQKTVMPLASELNKSLNVGNDKDKAANLLHKLDSLHGLNFQAQQLSRPEQLTLMVDGGKRPVSSEQFMDQFESILAKSSFMKSGGAQKLLINLNPGHLGSLRIELIQKDQVMIARILTSTATAKETLENHVQSLKQAFVAQNITMDRVEISQQMTDQERSFNRNQQEEQNRNEGDNNRRKDNEQTQTSDDFTNTFEEALLNAEV